MSRLIAMFCDIDDFCKWFEPLYTHRLLQSGQRHRTRQTALALSEIMTIRVYFHASHYRDFKHYYTDYVEGHLCPYFPALVSYSRFVELMPRALVPLCGYLHTRRGQCTGITFVDSTSLAVCHNRRSTRHKVFDGYATRGKSSMGWFFGCKLHLMINDEGELLAFRVTTGEVDDREPVKAMAEELWGCLYGDRGYISSARPAAGPGPEADYADSPHHETAADATVGSGHAPEALSDRDVIVAIHKKVDLVCRTQVYKVPRARRKTARS
jgi:Transposase DDE domain